MSDPERVFVSDRYLELIGPGNLVYHASGRHHFPKYEIRPDGSAAWDSPEIGWLRCGRRWYWDEDRPDLASQRNPSGHTAHLEYRVLRLDNAQALGGRPCRGCFGAES